jgi:alcohol dehydrogenase, propanol-preferring
MKSAVLEEFNQPLLIKETPDPQVGPRDVLIRVAAASVCHTDLHLAEGLLAGAGVRGPLIMGHETAGTVEQAGAEVTNVKPGDRVGAYWLLTCGHCRNCTAGEEESCQGGAKWAGFHRPGGYAEYLAIPAEFAIPLPDEIDFIEAAPLFCGGLTVYGALKNTEARPGERVAVLGIGGLGHLALAIARAMGTEVIALTSTESKAGLAREMGAHHVIAGDDLGKRLAAMGGADVIVSTTVDPKPLADIYQGLRPLGRLAPVGVTMDPLPIPPLMLFLNQQKIVGSVVGSRADMRAVLNLAARDNIRPKTETFPLDAVNQAHDRLRANQVRFRAVLTPS